jgi:hypothetical protein
MTPPQDLSEGEKNNVSGITRIHNMQWYLPKACDTLALSELRDLRPNP